MQSTSDIQLLRSYATDGSEAAFAELVRRHADLVYSAALRQVDSPDLASIIGWLYRGVRYEALDLRRTELRRRHRVHCGSDRRHLRPRRAGRARRTDYRDIERFGEERRVFKGRITDSKVGLTGLTNLVASLNAENDRLQAQAIDGLKLHRQAVQLPDKTQREVSGADPDVQEALRWKANKEKLHHLFADRPDQWIPELALIDEDDWLSYGRNADLDSEQGIRKALSAARRAADNTFASEIQSGVMLFQQTHDGAFPKSPADLATYLKPPDDASWLQRYTVLPSDQFQSRLGGDWVITQKSAVDEDNDSRWLVGAVGYSTGEFKIDPNTALMNSLRAPVGQYAIEHGGKEPNTVEELEPYLKTPQQKAAFAKVKDTIAEQLSKIRK